jgi:hypothetical protein
MAASLYFRIMTRIALSLALILVTATAVLPAPKTPRLAVLVGAPWDGEKSMSNDVGAAAAALRRRGFAPDEILVLDGQLTRAAVLSFVGLVRQRIAPWKSGEILITVSAHGTFTGTKVSEARPGLLLSAREPVAAQIVFWDEIFNALNVPDGVRVILLPDS